MRVGADVYTYKVLLEPNSLPPSSQSPSPTHSLTCIQLPRSFISLCNLRYTSPARPSLVPIELASDEVVARRISYKHESGLGKKWEISRRRARRRRFRSKVGQSANVKRPSAHSSKPARPPAYIYWQNKGYETDPFSVPHKGILQMISSF